MSHALLQHHMSHITSHDQDGKSYCNSAENGPIPPDQRAPVAIRKGFPPVTSTYQSLGASTLDLPNGSDGGTAHGGAQAVLRRCTLQSGWPPVAAMALQAGHGDGSGDHG